MDVSQEYSKPRRLHLPVIISKLTYGKSLQESTIVYIWLIIFLGESHEHFPAFGQNKHCSHHRPLSHAPELTALDLLSRHRGRKMLTSWLAWLKFIISIVIITTKNQPLEICDLNQGMIRSQTVQRYLKCQHMFAAKTTLRGGLWKFLRPVRRRKKSSSRTLTTLDPSQGFHSKSGQRDKNVTDR